MKNFLAELQVVPGFSTAIDTQHLALQGMQPDHLGMLVEKLFVQKNIAENGSPLLRKLLAEGRTEAVESWPVVGVKYPIVGYQSIHILGDIMPIGTEHGKGGDDFYIWTVENFLVPADEISPGDVRFQVRIQTPGEPYKGGWRYRVKAKFKEKSASIPKKYFNKGTSWTKMWASGEEGNQQKGSTFFPARPLSTQISGGKINKGFKLTDFAQYNNPNMHCKVTMKEGGMIGTGVLTWAEKIANDQFMNEISRYMMFNLKGDDVFGSTNRAVPYATGIYHQIKENGWYFPYQKLTEKFIKGVTRSIFQGRVGYDSGDIYAYAGSEFIRQFNEANMDGLIAKNAFIGGELLARKVSSDISSNGLEVGAQVVTMLLDNHKKLHIIYEPIFDDPELWSEKDPITGAPKMSGTAIILNVTGVGNKSNIRIIHPKMGKMYVNYKTGNVPWSGLHGMSSNNSAIATTSDDFEIVYTANMLPFLDDPTCCALLELNR